MAGTLNLKVGTQNNSTFMKASGPAYSFRYASKVLGFCTIEGRMAIQADENIQSSLLKYELRLSPSEHKDVLQ